jgi:NitT/TauT family transport system ATP-binding protein
MNLDVKGVKKYFPVRGRVITALEQIDLTIAAGEFLCIVGPSGCGKSTLLKLLAGLETPSEGQIFANGQPLCGTDPSRVLIFQDAALFPWLTVQANVEFGLKMKGYPRQQREEISGKLLEMVHLDGFRQALVHELSGGMKQRVALARALAVDPAVLLLDEPFGALDAITRDLLHTELQEIWLKTGKTIVFITHNVREAVVLGDRVVVMSAYPGRIVAEHPVNFPRPRQIEDTQVTQMARRVAVDLKLTGDVLHEHAV